jgi:DnaJ homolog subfamily C member 7
MDLDGDSPQAVPVSPPPQKMPGGFDIPRTNGTNGVGAGDAEGPVPPPHKSNSTSPTPAAAPTPEDAEAFKNAGNKFYKAKEYGKAIDEYTKGMTENPVHRARLTII